MSRLRQKIFNCKTIVLFIFEKFGGIMLGVDLKPNLIKRFLVIELYSGFFKYVGNKFNRVYTESTSWNSECPTIRTIKTHNKIEISFFQNIAYEDVD